MAVDVRKREPTRAKVREQVATWLERAIAGRNATESAWMGAVTPTFGLKEAFLRAEQTVRVLEDVAKFMDGGTR
jgi:hypothetical protein